MTAQNLVEKEEGDFGKRQNIVQKFGAAGATIFQLNFHVPHNRRRAVQCSKSVIALMFPLNYPSCSYGVHGVDFRSILGTACNDRFVFSSLAKYDLEKAYNLEICVPVVTESCCYSMVSQRYTY